MDEGLIARRYAKAVFRYAQELNAALHGYRDRTGRGIHQGYSFVDKKPPGNVCQVNLLDVSEDLPGCKRDYPGEDYHGDGVVGRDDG